MTDNYSDEKLKYSLYKVIKNLDAKKIDSKNLNLYTLIKNFSKNKM